MHAFEHLDTYTASVWSEASILTVEDDACESMFQSISQLTRVGNGYYAMAGPAI